MKSIKASSEVCACARWLSDNEQFLDSCTTTCEYKFVWPSPWFALRVQDSTHCACRMEILHFCRFHSRSQSSLLCIYVGVCVCVRYPKVFCLGVCCVSVLLKEVKIANRVICVFCRCGFAANIVQNENDIS